MNTLTWLNTAISLYNREQFQGSDCESEFWKAISEVELETGCDPVRGIRICNEPGDEQDRLIISFSYFSVCLLGCFTAVRDPRVKRVIIVGQEEEIEEHHLHDVSLLLEPLKTLVTKMCEYSKDFDNRFREKVSNV